MRATRPSFYWWLAPLAVCLAAAALTTVAGAASPVPGEKAKLTASDGVQGDTFGISVAISNSIAVVTAPFKDSATGAAYVFVRSDGKWSQEAKLTASDGAAGDQFGVSASISGETVVVGAWQDDSKTGAAYVFVRSGTVWSQQAKLIADDGIPRDLFGYSVAISGARAVVGAYGADGLTGAAYIFVRSGTKWSQQEKLTDPDGERRDRFGLSVVIARGPVPTVVVGANGWRSNTGSAYVFTRAHAVWSERARLIASDGAAGDFFGDAVAISDGRIAVGAPSKPAAYVFAASASGWSQEAKLTASDAGPGDHFGLSIAMSGSRLVAGDYAKDSFVGAAYAFERSGGTWAQQAKLTPSDGHEGDFFGDDVAVSGSTAIVGAPGGEAAYVFRL